MQSLYDISDIQAISRGNNDFVLKMLKMFVDYTPHNVKEMKERYAAKDLTGMGELAHSIKPTIDSMGITAIKDTIREIEKTGRDKNDSPELPALLEKIEVTINDVVAAVKLDYPL
ncbi:MAG TPA: Hpt domain-containing protein [Ferruginibacter sp.]|nr:Hpt domain-containing protein [Ferruginibacter sp.]